MTVPADVAARYTYDVPYIKHVAGMVRDVLSAHCDDHGFAYIGRQKTLASLWEKLETGRFGAWDEIDDLFACTVIVPRVSDEAPLLDFLKSTFVEVETKKRGTTQKAPSVFRFDATRFYGRLTTLQATEPGSRIASITFEIQIRTAFEHAWSVATHALSYKGGTVDWRLQRFAAQLKASVEQLDGLVSSYERAAGEMAAHPWPETEAKLGIETFFKTYILAGTLPKEYTPESWVRFCDSLFDIVMSSQRKHIRPRNIPAVITTAMEPIRIAIEEEGFSAPKSLSLLQFCLGTLATAGTIDRPIPHYTPPTFEELRSLYPKVDVLGQGFKV